MHPTNQYMDPYHSYCRDHPPYPYYPPPGWEAGHPRMSMDSSCRPPSYGPWPYGGSTSHSCPPEFPSYCNHTYPPGYYSFRPPFSQELPPPHLYYHGPFPHHLNAYPSYYVPPPTYPIDQAYGYDKFKSHCCGCPNHTCHSGEKSNLKIEEETPEMKPQSDLKSAKNSSIIRHPNYQYPAMWLPSGNMKDKGEVPPQLMSRWAPEAGERTGDMKQQEEDNWKAKKFQWPIIWMPAGYDEPKQETKQLTEMGDSPKVSEDAPPSPKIKIIPLSCFDNGNHDQGSAAKDRSRDHNERLVPMSQPASTEHQDGSMVDGNVKTIPVVPQKPNNEKNPVGRNYKTIPVVPDRENDGKKIGGTCRTIPVVNEKEINEKEPDSKEGKKAGDAERGGEKGERKNVELLKVKPSKLPPVCLRVDPLPRKKSGNTCSRSPSLQNNKDDDKDKKGVKQTPGQNLDTKISDPKKDISMAEVKDKSSGEIGKTMGPKNATVQEASVKHTQEKQIPTSTVDQKVQATPNIETQENAGTNPLQESDKTTKEDEIKIGGEAEKFAGIRKIYLSEPDAAVHIQSAYRGYHVRRWQPLEKLRKIKNIHEQMQDVKKQLQDLEASSKQPAVKEQVAINETIMNLLLELDMIQGLHPSVREARKSVARELTYLEEKLDSLCKHPFGECSHSNSDKASEEQKYAGVCEEPGSCSIDSKELMHGEVLPSVSMELRQDVDSVEQKHLMERSSTTKEEAHDEGKSVAPGECEGASLMDVMRDAALSGHSTEQKHQMEESNTISTQECPEEELGVDRQCSCQQEKAAAKGVGSSEHYMEPLHDTALSEGSSMLKQCTSSTEHDCHTEVSNTGVSPAATSDSTTAVATSSMENGVPVENDGSVESQVWSSAAVEISAPTEEDQCKEPMAPFVHLEDLSVSLENAEAHENDPVLTDTRQGSTNQTNGTPETLVGCENNMHHVTAENAEDTVQSSLLEETSQSDSFLEEIVLEESEATQQSEVSCRDDSTFVDQQTDHHVENPTGCFAIGEEPLVVPLKSEAAIMEGTLSIAGSPSNMVTEPTLSESESFGLPCEHDGTGVHENPGSKVSSESQNDDQKECESGDKTSEGMEVSDVVECKEILEEAPVCGAGPNSAELEVHYTKEDVGMQTAYGEAASVSATRDGLKNDDEKKLAEENQKLKEMLQKLLASGNDQMNVISELSEKVKTLEWKVARKKRPKVRLHRPARDATAKGH